MQKLLFFPVCERAPDVALRVIEGVRNPGQGKFAPGIAAAQQIKIDFHELAVRRKHVFIKKTIMNQRIFAGMVFMYDQIAHLLMFFLKKCALLSA
ncbi:hypothetical protein BRYFOR_05270 [Marvinbryantia formatexigens DSM 14469]|uniref:Uncharacterized protein n=1 Tax=Marvinbryantia formatexigens DSM 14469 TaxID=478749 RepID=C6L9I1_9FIRM|nr:hypothetical protein BRYFOR_05270 [Marvinbryantia formatexigens DSM 14469]